MVEVASSGDSEVIQLVGPAASLSGELTLTNPTEARVVVRDGVLAMAGHRSAAQVRAIVAPGQVRRIRVSASLPEGTVPGEYEAELIIGGRSSRAICQVVDVVRVEVTPPMVLVDVPPGAPAFKRVVVTNRSTVAVQLRPPARMTVEAEPGVDPECERREIDVRFPAVTIEPAATAAFDVSVTVPAGLREGTRWKGRIPLATASLDLVVTPRRAPKKPPTSSASKAMKPPIRKAGGDVPPPKRAPRTRTAS